MRHAAIKDGETAVADNSAAPHNSRFGNGSGHSGAIQDHLQQLAREVMFEISELTLSHSAELLGAFVSELFLLVEEQRQREVRRQKQAKGIAAAKARGVQLGRSPKPLPVNFEECYQRWRDGKISMREAASACGMSKTWFRDAAMRKEQIAECAV